MTMAEEEPPEEGSAKSDDAHDRGPLLWPRFYGPSVEYNRPAFDRHGILVLAAAATAPFLATGLLLLRGSAESGRVELRLVRGQLSDAARFESLLRRKTKDVE